MQFLYKPMKPNFTLNFYKPKSLLNLWCIILAFYCVNKIFMKKTWTFKCSILQTFELHASRIFTSFVLIVATKEKIDVLKSCYSQPSFNTIAT
jgi:hypothetical protein